MSEEQSPAPLARPRRRGRARAVLAGCAVLGIGATVTLAAWTDTEWVYGGGAGAGDPIATSTFEVEQNVFDATGFTNRETSPGGQLTFAPGASALTPGDAVTAAMQLRTAVVSDAAVVTLEGAAVNGSDADLFAEVTYGVYTGITAANCDAQIFTGGGVLVAEGSPLTTGGAPDAITLAADAGDLEDLCFVISLPADAPDTVQGESIAPAWLFNSDSVTP